MASQNNCSLNNTYSQLSSYKHDSTRITPPWHDHTRHLKQPHQFMGEGGPKPGRSQDHTPTLNLDPRGARSDLEFWGPRLAGGTVSTNDIAPTLKANPKDPRGRRTHQGKESEKREERSRTRETLADMTRTDDISRDFGNSFFYQLLKSDVL